MNLDYSDENENITLHNASKILKLLAHIVQWNLDKSIKQ